MKSLALILIALLPALVLANKVTLNADGVIEIDGKKVFPLSTSLPPLPGQKTPDGVDGLKQLKQDGLSFVRIRPTTGVQDYTEPGIRSIRQWLDAAREADLYCWVTLGKLPMLDAKKPKVTAENEKLLRLAVQLYKDHPALAVWKGYDEPAWVKMPAEPLARSYQLFKQLDPNHPVIIIQAPMKDSLPLEPYKNAADILGVDIYPITYPPGNHSDLKNKGISLVADWTKIVRDAAAPKPIWMTLQIAWAGTAYEGKTLRFPTFPEQHYMTYAAIINGARGVNFQGGERPLALNERDSKLGWNWTYWFKVMRPLMAELRDGSPLHPALLAPNSKLDVRLSLAAPKPDAPVPTGPTDIDFLVREVGNEVFILAARREGAIVKAKFENLPVADGKYELLYEEPRMVEVKGGAFEDWFAGNEVHVYRLKHK